MEGQEQQEQQQAPGVEVSTPPPFYLLTPELQFHVAEFLPVRDLLNFQCTSKEISQLNTDTIWKIRCEQRWESWPRYKLTKERHAELLSSTSSSFQHLSCWQQRYMAIEEDATRTTLQANDFTDLKWNLSFILSGVRGERRSDHMEVQFHRSGFLHVPGYPPLPYRLWDESFLDCDGISRGHPGDHDNYVTSTNQHLLISNFPPHCITRRRSDAEWLIYNENVNIVSCGYKK